ncbi:PA2169 family four-helix-bundle protein [Arcticibacter sp. MXS-1]|uniref:ferritin-like domain-containing protein n=1 Tax=Arcticibacter sp. MXS-1 TaxID=3341726 RepID=UPI0035A8EA86
MNYPENYTRQLQTLLRLVEDSSEGYKTAAEHASSQEFIELFRGFAAEREMLAEELRERIARYGVHAEEPGSDFMASLHRSWMGIKTAMTKKDDQAVLESCRNGDQSVLDAYDDMMQGDLLNDTDMKTFLSGQRYTINRAFMDLDKRYFDLFKKDPSI